MSGRLGDALDVLAGLVLEDGRCWGAAATAFQWADARAVLNPTASAPYHFLTRARGGAKTGDLAGIALAAMITEAPVGARLYGFGADRDQARLLLDSAAGYRARTPLLRGALDVQAFRIVVPRSGVVLEIMAADASGAWGIRPWLTVVDEIAQWGATGEPRRLWEAVSSATTKVPNARLAVLTTAGDPAHWSAKVRDHALADPLWRVHEVPGPPPWADAARLEEQRRRLPPSIYARLFENRWTAAEDRLTTVDDIAACTVLDGPLPPSRGTSYTIGLDVGVVNDRTVAVVCHAEPLRRVVDTSEIPSGSRIFVDRIEVWSGSREQPVQLAEVGEWLRYVAREYNGATVVFDPHQAIDLTQRLARGGIRTVKFDFHPQSVGRLALALYRALRARTLAIPNDPELVEELLNVRLRESSPGTYRIDHDSDAHDDRVIALALCVERLLSRPVSRGTSHIARGRIPGVGHGSLEEIAGAAGIPIFNGGGWSRRV